MRYNYSKIYGSVGGSGIIPIYGGNTLPINAPGNTFGFTPSGVLYTIDPPSGTDDCGCVPTIDPLIALQNLLDCIKLFDTALDQFYTVVNVRAPLVANISMVGSMPLNVYVRYLWSKLNPGRKFDVTLHSNLNELKDIYLRLNIDWQTDAFLVTSEFMFIEKQMIAESEKDSCDCH